MWVRQNSTLSPAYVAFNFEWRQMLCRLKLRQWKEPFLSTYRSMSSHSIIKSEAISTRLMTPFWKAGELWPRGRRIVGGGARKSTSAGWGISLTAFIMSAIYFFSVSSSNTSQIAYCGLLLNGLSLWSSVSKILKLCTFNYLFVFSKNSPVVCTNCFVSEWAKSGSFSFFICNNTSVFRASFRFSQSNASTSYIHRTNWLCHGNSGWHAERWQAAKQTEIWAYIRRFTGRNHVATGRGRTPWSESISCVLITRAAASGEQQL